MAKKIEWERVSFGESKTESVCELTFRPNGQIVFDVATLEALQYPKYVALFASPSDHLIAIKATAKADNDTLQLTATALDKGAPRTIMAKKVSRWLLALLKQEEGQVLVKLTGAPNEEGMVVFDLKKADIKAKRVITRKASEA